MGPGQMVFFTFATASQSHERIQILDNNDTQAGNTR